MKAINILTTPKSILGVVDPVAMATVLAKPQNSDLQGLRTKEGKFLIMYSGTSLLFENV